jgi:hypothetical protein
LQTDFRNDKVSWMVWAVFWEVFLEVWEVGVEVEVEVDRLDQEDMDMAAVAEVMVTRQADHPLLVATVAALQPHLRDHPHRVKELEE